MFLVFLCLISGVFALKIRSNTVGKHTRNLHFWYKIVFQLFEYPLSPLIFIRNSHHPFGMLMPERSYSASNSYNYSINGQEKEKELNENITSAEFWMYDSRIARRWNMDPVFSEYESPYVCFSNNPIRMIDPLGNSDSTYSTPDHGTITLPEQAKILSRFEANTRYKGQSNGVTLNVADGSVNQFEYNGEIYSARFNSKGEFTKYQSQSDASHFLSYSKNALPSWEIRSRSGFQNFAYAGLVAPVTKVNPWVAGGFIALAGIAWLAGDNVNDLLDDVTMTRPVAIPTTQLPPPPPILLYRGVHAKHPDYANALLGIATPWGGHTDPKKHNEGNNQSIFTSWTINKNVARMWATSNGSGGVILSKYFNIMQTVPSPDTFREGEVLIPGIVTGANVERLGSK